MQDVESQPAALLPGVLRRFALFFALSLVIAFLWTWAQTGSVFADGEWADAFFARTIQLTIIGAIVAMQRFGLLIGIVTGIVFAFVTIIVFQGEMATYAWIGDFFLNALKMIIVPLIFFAMIVGITSMGDVRKLGRLGGRTVGYYFATTAIAVILGALFVNIMAPGEGANIQLENLEITEAFQDKIKDKAGQGFDEIIMSFVSPNIGYSMGAEKPQMLPLIVFSILFGAVLTTLGAKGRAVIDFCEGGNEAMMKIVHLLMLLAPVGIFGLVAGRFGEELAKPGGSEAFITLLESLAKYGATVLVGLAVHALIVIPILLKTLTGRSPLRYARGMANALMTAFSTASSAATLPLTLESCEENNKVDKRATRFVIPMGATINMDGTALYEAVAVIFLAQGLGIDLSIGQQVVVIITATLAAIGAAGIPEAGLFTMFIVLQAVGIPVEAAWVIYPIDWLLDRFRTTVNVWGDAVGAAVMEKHGLPPDEPPTPTGSPAEAAIAA